MSYQEAPRLILDQSIEDALSPTNDYEWALLTIADIVTNTSGGNLGVCDLLCKVGDIISIQTGIGIGAVFGEAARRYHSDPESINLHEEAEAIICAFDEWASVREELNSALTKRGNNHSPIDNGNSSGNCQYDLPPWSRRNTEQRNKHPNASLRGPGRYGE